MSEQATEPQTRDDWVDAANLAEFFLSIDAARKYGLIRGGPEVDVDRCLWMKAEAGRLHGIEPHFLGIEQITREWFLNTFEIADDGDE